MTALDSGNSQRDGHVKERDDLLADEKFPQSAYTAKSITSGSDEYIERAFAEAAKAFYSILNEFIF